MTGYQILGGAHVIGQADSIFSRIPLMRGYKGPDVKAVQYALTRKGYVLKVNGTMDDATERAVKSLQRAERLPEDGTVGYRELAALGLADGGGSTPKKQPPAPSQPQWDDPWLNNPQSRAPTPPRTPTPQVPSPMDDAWKDRFSSPKTPAYSADDDLRLLFPSKSVTQSKAPTSTKAPTTWLDPWADDPKGRPASVPYTPPMTQPQKPASKPSGGGSSFWSNLFSPKEQEPEPVFTLSIPPIIPYTEPAPNWYLIGSILAAVTVVGGLFLIGASK